MLVVDLHCKNSHHFEGWFASSDDLASQQARGLVSCPVCGDDDVVRRPSAPHLNVSHLKTEARPSAGRIRPEAGALTPSRAVGSVPAVAEAQRVDAPSMSHEAAMQALQVAYLKWFATWSTTPKTWVNASRMKCAAFTTGRPQSAPSGVRLRLRSAKRCAMKALRC